MSPICQRITVVVLLALVFAGLSACDKGEGELSGSVSEFYDISYHHMRARLYSSELAIEYVRESGDVPVRISLRREAFALAPGTYDLKLNGDISGQSRHHELPRLESGRIELKEFRAEVGFIVRGEFSATLRAGDTKASIRGSFEAPLEIIDDGTRPDVGIVEPPDIVVIIEDILVPVEDIVVPVEDIVVPVVDILVPVEDIVVPVEDILVPVEDITPIEDTTPVEDTTADVQFDAEAG
ncbi:MAG: hypothetical protein H0U74_23495 [Bradymonadaceae bacterium]|nr:hypothetical protein [Lujinxingiaceae bacterium]